MQNRRLVFEAIILLTMLLSITIFGGGAAGLYFDRRPAETTVSRTITNPVVHPGDMLVIDAQFDIKRPECDFKNVVTIANGVLSRLAVRDWAPVSPKNEKGIVKVTGRIKVPENMPADTYALIYEPWQTCNPVQRVFGGVRSGPTEHLNFTVVER